MMWPTGSLRVLHVFVRHEFHSADFTRYFSNTFGNWAVHECPDHWDSYLNW